MNWIWGIGHSAWITLIALPLSFIPGIGGLFSLAFCIYIGVKGNELAWRNRRFESLEQFRDVQKAWTKWGVILLVVSLVIGISVGIAFVMMGARAPRA